MGPAKTYGRARFPGVSPESYHSLLFWVALLENKRIDAGRPFARALLADLRLRAQRAYVTAPSADPAAQPIIIAEPPEPQPISRLFVIWDDWAHLSQQDRSELIMNAYEHAKGLEEAVRISVAMGLTSAESARMGIVQP
jgi:hypothetical protein